MYPNLACSVWEEFDLKQGSPIVFGLVFVLICLSLSGCSSRYMAFDEHGRRIPPSREQLAAGQTLFERSLHYEYKNSPDVVGIGFYLMYDLMRELAEHDGPGSDRMALYQELQELDVVMDSARVMQIFNQGLADLDVSLHTGGGNLFVEQEIPKRAEQIRRYHCFLPGTARHFDALGELIKYHGVFELTRWDSETMTVTFSNDMAVVIGEDDAGEHYVIRSAEKLGKLMAMELPDGLVNYTIPNMGEQEQFIMEQQNQVRVDADYDELDVADINFHILPTSKGDGRWNGHVPPSGEGPWDYSRAFIDFFLNIDELNIQRGPSRNSVALSIEYEIWRVETAVPSLVAAETLSYQSEVPPGSHDDGLAFRFTSRPFVTRDDTTLGNYRMDLRVSDGLRVAARKHAFVVEPRRYELLVLDDQKSEVLGIPFCQRTPTSRPGETVTVLLPVKQMPYCKDAQCHCARLNVYLIDNEKVHDGRVEIGRVEEAEFVDSAVSVPRYSDRLDFRATVDVAALMSLDVQSESPSTYLTCCITIPRVLPDGSPVKAGMYSIGAAVVGPEGIISEALMTDLRMK